MPEQPRSERRTQNSYFCRQAQPIGMKENQRIEWKETWRDEFLRWICAFANAEGGRLHIGRNDTGVVVGVLGMIEAWGRGVERIMEACRTAKTPMPKLRYEPSGLWVEFALPPGGSLGWMKSWMKSWVKTGRPIPKCRSCNWPISLVSIRARAMI